jgi:hypothetical protein
MKTFFLLTEMFELIFHKSRSLIPDILSVIAYHVRIFRNLVTKH